MMERKRNKKYDALFAHVINRAYIILNIQLSRKNNGESTIFNDQLF